MSINRVIVTGNITRDPEKHKAGDTPVISFGVAVNEWRKAGEFTHFFDVDVFGKRAQGLADILHKGMRVTIEGKLRYQQWTSEGQKRSKVSIIADNVEFMSPKRAADASESGETEETPW